MGQVDQFLSEGGDSPTAPPDVSQGIGQPRHDALTDHPTLDSGATRLDAEVAFGQLQAVVVTSTDDYRVDGHSPCRTGTPAESPR